MLQYFNPHSPSRPPFELGPPRLEYSCKTLESHKIMPRTLHVHEDVLEMVFILFGRGFHTIGDAKYRTGPGDLLIYNAGTVHDEVAAPGENLSVYCVGVSNLRLPGIPANHLLPEDVGPVWATGTRAGEFEAVFERIHACVLHPSTFGAEILGGLLQALLFMALDLVSALDGTDRSVDEHALAGKVKQYIDAHYLEQLSLPSIAAAFGMSQHYLSHLFKDSEGMSPGQYIIRRRIGAAQSLLIHTDESVTAIAYKVGYNNANHFHVAFQKMVGLSPKNYREYWVAGNRH